MDDFEIPVGIEYPSGESPQEPEAVEPISDVTDTADAVEVPPTAADDPTVETWEPPPTEEEAGAGSPPLPPPPPPPPPPSEPAAPSRSWRRGVAMVVAALLAGAAAGGVVGHVTASDSGSSTSVSTAAPAGPVSVTKPGDIHQILGAVQPAVVAVRTQAFRRGTFFPSEGAGSGMILTSDGVVLTNAHVVEGATSIQVTLNGQSNAKTADLLGIDTSHDVALVKIQGAKNLPAVDLGSSSSLQVGDSVVAIGNALDLGNSPTVTEGIVSAIDRSIQAPGESLSGLIQTDAAINPGNSGGPLVNASGQVVGMNTAIAGNAQNIGFAIAIDNVKPIIKKIEANPGQTNSNQAPGGGFLGVSVDDAPGGGAQIVQVVPGSPAAQAGLASGDVVTRVDGTSIGSAQDLVDAVHSHGPGDQVSLTWSRSGRQHTAKVDLASSAG